MLVVDPSTALLANPNTKTPLDVAEDVLHRMRRPPTRAWWLLFGAAVAALSIGVASIGYLLSTGIGVWGLNRSVAWAYDITNFVFWIGIGHAGTLISAVLLLFRQQWRTGVNRAAELMTLFAIICAAIFPIIHLGRPWLFFWLLPLPNTMGPLWVNFHSPLTWDVIAIATYFTISLLFFYLGLLPDLGKLRDTSSGRRRRLLQWFSLHWNGSQRTWARHEKACLLLAALATPLVVSVHSVVSFDFAASIVPGWHTTVFPPYFVAGAIFSGMAMVLVLLIVVRKVMGLEAYITARHIEAMCKIALAMSGLLGFVYLIEAASAWQSQHLPDQFINAIRMRGPLAWAYWSMIVCNVLLPQMLWARKVRRSFAAVLVIAVFANVGMWLERFVIIVSSLERDYLPAMWVDYMPTRFEVATLVGGFGFFFTFFLLFCRLLPIISMSEIEAEMAKERRLESVR